MFLDETILILLWLLTLAAFVIAILAKSQAHRVDSEMKTLRKRLAEAETRLRHLDDGTMPAASPPQPAKAVEVSEVVEGSDAVEIPPSLPEAKAPPAPPPAKPRLSTERALTERWLVWLGGLALALGGAFMVKLSVEQGLLGPEVRVVLGILAGAGLMAGGHWLKRRSAANSLPWQVPPVLVGAGGSMLFAALFAAHGLYHMIGQLPAFAALALVAATVALMSVAHGPYVAGLALVGAYAVPLLVRSDSPNAVGLFAYLLVVSAGLLALLRWRAWLWLAWGVLVASAGWTVVWLFGQWQTGDEVVVGAYLLALFGLFAAFRLGIPQVPALAGRIEAPQARRVVLIAVMVIAALVVPVAGAGNFSSVGLALPLLLGLGCVAFGRHDRAFDTLPWVAALALLGVLAAWDWPAPRPFAVTAGLGAVLWGVGGFFLALRAPRPWVWAAGMAALPAALLAVAYWRLSGLVPDWGWSTAAVFLAALQVAAAERFNRYRGRDGFEAALAAAATGVVAALALAATFALAEAWLTVALAVLVAGIAWVEGVLRVPGLRKVALVVAGAVVVRLVANPSLLDYALPADTLVNWLSYGYGLPALAFALAARMFRRGAEDLLVAVLEAGAVTFATLLVNLQIHVRMGGGLDFDHAPPLAEGSLQAVAWSAGAAMLFLLHRRGGSRVLLGAGWVLWGLATAQAVLVQALFDNPLVTGVPIGEGAVINLLLLAFAAPAALYALHAVLAPERPAWARPACAGLALAFAFLWVSLEVRHAFAGPRLDATQVSDAEMWVYSVVWLLGGAAMLAGGIWRRHILLRRAGLGVVLLVVAKVFILDMAQLSGLWRALSFLGLGGVLVAIGGLYRRFAKNV